jgi:hypothetical protein
MKKALQHFIAVVMKALDASQVQPAQTVTDAIVVHVKRLTVAGAHSPLVSAHVDRGFNPLTVLAVG